VTAFNYDKYFDLVHFFWNTALYLSQTAFILLKDNIPAIPNIIVVIKRIPRFTINKFFPETASIENLNPSTAYVAGLILVRIDNHLGILSRGNNAPLRK
jgi:hypothetical protein